MYEVFLVYLYLYCNWMIRNFVFVFVKIFMDWDLFAQNKMLHKWHGNNDVVSSSLRIIHPAHNANKNKTYIHLPRGAQMELHLISPTLRRRFHLISVSSKDSSWWYYVRMYVRSELIVCVLSSSSPRGISATDRLTDWPTAFCADRVPGVNGEWFGFWDWELGDDDDDDDGWMDGLEMVMSDVGKFDIDEWIR